MFLRDLVWLNWYVFLTLDFSFQETSLVETIKSIASLVGRSPQNTWNILQQNGLECVVDTSLIRSKKSSEAAVTFPFGWRRRWNGIGVCIVNQLVLQITLPNNYHEVTPTYDEAERKIRWSGFWDTGNNHLVSLGDDSPRRWIAALSERVQINSYKLIWKTNLGKLEQAEPDVIFQKPASHFWC